MLPHLCHMHAPNKCIYPRQGLFGSDMVAKILGTPAHAHTSPAHRWQDKDKGRPSSKPETPERPSTQVGGPCAPSGHPCTIEISLTFSYRYNPHTGYSTRTRDSTFHPTSHHHHGANRIFRYLRVFRVGLSTPSVYPFCTLSYQG